MSNFLISILDGLATCLNELKKNQEIYFFVDTPASRKFKFFNLYPAAKGPPAVIKNIRTSLIRTGLPHRVIFIGEMNLNLKCNLKKSKARVVLIPKWDRKGDDLVDLLYKCT